LFFHKTNTFFTIKSYNTYARIGFNFLAHQLTIRKENFYPNNLKKQAGKKYSFLFTL
tara:strand:+ start:121 stop:291 length:171 start_codon:yes stop_codon:yes gene_type:complete